MLHSLIVALFSTSIFPVFVSLDSFILIRRQARKNLTTMAEDIIKKIHSSSGIIIMVCRIFFAQIIVKTVAALVSVLLKRKNN